MPSSGLRPNTTLNGMRNFDRIGSAGVNPTNHDLVIRGTSEAKFKSGIDINSMNTANTGTNHAPEIESTTERIAIATGPVDEEHNRLLL